MVLHISLRLLNVQRKFLKKWLQTFRVDAKRIHVWCSQKERLIALKDGKLREKRVDCAGRKPKDVEMEEALFGWIFGLVWYPPPCIPSTGKN